MELPTYISQEAWNDWVEYRLNEGQKKFNDSAAKGEGEMTRLLETGFDKWWSIYPRKRGSKSGAKQTWIRKRLALRENELIEILEMQIASDPQWQEMRFIPYPTTYLNQERWNDEIDIASHQQNETPRDKAQRELAEWERSNSSEVLGSDDGNVSGSMVIDVRPSTH